MMMSERRKSRRNKSRYEEERERRGEEDVGEPLMAERTNLIWFVSTAEV
jgi:hypothetical protein